MLGVFAIVLFYLKKEWEFYESYKKTNITKQPPPPKQKAQSTVQIEELPTARVKWIFDGDTVAVTQGWHELTIRLDSIDCPEDGQHWGDIAKYALMKLLNRKNVHLEVHGLDHYGRTLATIYVWGNEKNEWLNVNERMVMLGHAWVMRVFYDHLPEDRQDKLNNLERWSKSKKIGLWGTPDPTPPWEWRKNNTTPTPSS